ncbi:MAG: alpha/beta fold hydrolase [Caulobacteraceae bacterium]
MTHRPTVVLLPGLLCDEEVWRGPIARLSPDHKVVCPGVLDQPSIEAMATQVLARAPERFSLAGHSMGGRVALEIAARAPHRLERLALLDTGFRPARPGEAEGRSRLIRVALEEGMAALARQWLPPMLAPQHTRDAALMAQLTAMVERATPRLFQRQIGALLTRPNAHRGLHAIPCPTAVIVGRLDAWSPLAQHEEMAALIPQARLTVIEDAGHMSPVEQPDAVAEALADWMGTEPARGFMVRAS